MFIATPPLKESYAAVTTVINIKFAANKTSNNLTCTIDIFILIIYFPQFISIYKRNSTYNKAIISVATNGAEARKLQTSLAVCGNSSKASVIDPNIVYGSLAWLLSWLIELCVRKGPHEREGVIL